MPDIYATILISFGGKWKIEYHGSMNEKGEDGIDASTYKNLPYRSSLKRVTNDIAFACA